MRIYILCYFMGAFLLLAHTSGIVSAQAASSQFSHAPSVNVQDKTDDYTIEAKYPTLGVETIDADIALWANNLIQQFKQMVLAEAPEIRRRPYFMGI